MNFRYLFISISVLLQAATASAQEFMKLSTIPEAGITVVAGMTEGEWCATNVDILMLAEDPAAVKDSLKFRNGLSAMSQVLASSCPKVKTIGIIGQDLNGKQISGAQFTRENNYAFSLMTKEHYRSRPALQAGNKTALDQLTVAPTSVNSTLVKKSKATSSFTDTVAGPEAGVQSVLSSPDLGPYLTSSRILNGRIIASYLNPFSSGPFDEAPRFGIKSGSDEFLDRLDSYLVILAGPKTYEDLQNWLGLDDLIGKEEAKKYFGRHGLVGSNEFEKADSLKGLLALFDRYRERNPLHFPLKLIAIQAFDFQEYDFEKERFPFNFFDPMGVFSQNISVNHNDYYNSLAGELISHNPYIPMNSDKARDILDTISADANSLLPNRKHRSGNRTGYIAVNYTINSVRPSHDGNDDFRAEIDVDIESMAIYSTPDLRNKLFDLMKPRDVENKLAAES